MNLLCLVLNAAWASISVYFHVSHARHRHIVCWRLCVSEFDTRDVLMRLELQLVKNALIKDVLWTVVKVKLQFRFRVN